jgi:hypothetical protein
LVERYRHPYTMIFTNWSENQNESDYFETPQNLYLLNRSNDFFVGLVENRISKISSVIFSALGSYLCIGMLYSIIWYEKFGSDSKRTLINRLFVYFWLCPMIWEATVQQVDIIRYIFGPMPKFVCRINYFLKLHFTIHALILLDFIVVARYIFIFWLKNPAAFNDEFWSVFINLWTFFGTALLQFVQTSLPGKDFPDIWICSGENPNLDLTPSYKSVFLNNFIKIFSLFIHIVISIKIKHYKWKTDPNEVARNPKSKLFWIFSLKTDSVIDVTESIVPFGLVGLAMLLNAPRGKQNLEMLNQYPECLTEYFYTLIRPILTVFLACSIKLIRDHHYRNALAKEIRNMMDK